MKYKLKKDKYSRKTIHEKKEELFLSFYRKMRNNEILRKS